MTKPGFQRLAFDTLDALFAPEGAAASSLSALAYMAELSKRHDLGWNVCSIRLVDRPPPFFPIQGGAPKNSCVLFEYALHAEGAWLSVVDQNGKMRASLFEGDWPSFCSLLVANHEARHGKKFWSEEPRLPRFDDSYCSPEAAARIEAIFEPLWVKFKEQRLDQSWPSAPPRSPGPRL